MMDEDLPDPIAMTEPVSASDIFMTNPATTFLPAKFSDIDATKELNF